jgi:serine/threonine-protein kinase
MSPIARLLPTRRLERPSLGTRSRGSRSLEGRTFDSRPPRPPWRERFQLGLLGRISLALVVVALLPLGAASFRLLGMSRDAMSEQVLRTHAVAARTAAARTEAFLAARRAAATLAAGSPALADGGQGPAATELLAALLQATPGAAAVSLRTPAGEEVMRAQRPELAVEAAAALTVEPAAELAVTRHGGAPWLRLEVPLPDGRGRLQLVCDLAPLAAELRPEELGEHAAMAVVDRRGAVVVGPSAATTAFPASMLAAARSGRIAGASRFGGDVGDDDAVLGAYAPVASAPWVVLSRQPAAVAESTARALRGRTLIALAFAVALALATTAAARQTIVRPLRALVAAQQRLAGTSGRALAGGEIAQLEASFVELERRLREREALDEVFLGRYQVQAVVGEGAMGTVFRAWDPALERPVAIKTVRFDRTLASERAELQVRLLGEAVTAARLTHSNVVGVYDVQQSPGVAFLAMEYVDGVSLERHLNARGHLPAAEAVAVAQGIARGLAAAHQRGVVHQDVKPANVLLGRDGAVKVVDFGISQVIGACRHQDADEPGTLVGTPGFMAPEMLRGGGPPVPAGDLFALGVTLYRMLTGAMPFGGRSVGDVLQRTLRVEPPPPGALAPESPSELDELVMSLLEKDPARRCPSAEEALCRLEALAARSPVMGGWRQVEPDQVVTCSPLRAC